MMDECVAVVLGWIIALLRDSLCSHARSYRCELRGKIDEGISIFTPVYILAVGGKVKGHAPPLKYAASPLARNSNGQTHVLTIGPVRILFNAQ